MNKYLLDTHIILWWLNDDKRLKKPLRQIIENSKEHIFLSIATAWEIGIKYKTGKLSLKTTLEDCFEQTKFATILPITLKHILILNSLPLHHRDPFDRLLIAQAKVEKLTILTNDPKFEEYPVKILR